MGILCGMWALWMMRNKRRHGEQSMTIQQAALWARDTAFDLWQLVHKPEPVCRFGLEAASVRLGES